MITAGPKFPRRGGRGKCAVCASAERDAIETAWIGGESQRSIALRVGISRSSIDAHMANHVSPALIALAKAGRTAPGPTTETTLVGRLGVLLDAAQKVLEASLNSGNPSQTLAAIREIRSTLELQGRASGELKDRPGIAVNLQTSPEWIATRSTIVEMLPIELRAKVAERLRGLDA